MTDKLKNVSKQDFLNIDVTTLDKANFNNEVDTFCALVLAIVILKDKNLQQKFLEKLKNFGFNTQEIKEAINAVILNKTLLQDISKLKKTWEIYNNNLFKIDTTNNSLLGFKDKYENNYPQSIEIPNFVTSIDYRAFRDCTGLASVTIPDSVTSIGKGAFFGCTNLQTVYCSPKLSTNIIDELAKYADVFDKNTGELIKEKIK